MNEEDYVKCAHCGRKVLDRKAIYISGTPFCEWCHGEVDYEDEDYDDDDDDEDEDEYDEDDEDDEDEDD